MIAAPSALTFLTYAEGGVWFLGATLAARILFTDTGRDLRVSPGPLPAWPLPFSGLLQAALCAAGGGYLGQLGVSHLSNATLGDAALDGQLWTVLMGAAFQFGMLAGLAVFTLFLNAQHRAEARLVSADLTSPPPPPAQPPLHAYPVAIGITTFAIGLPLVMGVGYVWKFLLEQTGYSTDTQELVELFQNADAPAPMLLMAVLAIFIAPLTEELIFRAGLFRYLRTRVPRWLAFVLPAALFGVLHNNLLSFLPLFAFGLLLALAYERTGRILVPIIAHSLFNLHTLLLLAAGAMA